MAEFHIPREQASKAAEWFARSLARIAERHSGSWPEHEEWVRDYLRAELAEHVKKT